MTSVGTKASHDPSSTAMLAATTMSDVYIG